MIPQMAKTYPAGTKKILKLRDLSGIQPIDGQGIRQDVNGDGGQDGKYDDDLSKGVLHACLLFGKFDLQYGVLPALTGSTQGG